MGTYFCLFRQDLSFAGKRLSQWLLSPADFGLLLTSCDDVGMSFRLTTSKKCSISSMELNINSYPKASTISIGKPFKKIAFGNSGSYFLAHSQTSLSIS